MSEFKKSYLLNPVRYFVHFRIVQTYYLLSNDRRMNVEIIHVSKAAFSGLLQRYVHVHILTDFKNATPLFSCFCSNYGKIDQPATDC